MLNALARRSAAALALLTAAVAAGVVSAGAASADTPADLAVSPSYGHVGEVVDVTADSGLSSLTEVQFPTASGTVDGTLGAVTDTSVPVTVPSGAVSGALTLVFSDASTAQVPAFTVTRSGTATLTGPTTVLASVAHTLTATLQDAAGPASGVTATLRAHPYGATSWTVIATRTTSSSGVATFSVRPLLLTTYEVRYSSASHTWTAQNVPSLAVHVTPSLAVTGPAIVPIHTTTPVTGTVYPAMAGKVTLQWLYGRTWRSLASVQPSQGRFTVPLTWARTGTYDYRVLRAADSGHTAASSSVFVVHAVPRSLRTGDTGSDVVALQKRLNALHYFTGAATSTYGYDLAQAVTAFEKVQGLPRDGVASSTVLSALAHPKVPVLRHPLAGFALEVDIAHQVVYVQSNRAVIEVLDASTAGGYYYTDSAGQREKAVTPTGHFSVTYKQTGWVKSKLGELYYPAYFNYSGYAVHGEGDVPPYPASHGCVRVDVHAQDWLYPRLAVGDSVWIY